MKKIQNMVDLLNEKLSDNTIWQEPIIKAVKASIRNKHQLRAFLFGKPNRFSEQLSLDVTENNFRNIFGGLRAALLRYFRRIDESAEIFLSDQSVILKGQKHKLGHGLRKAAIILYKKGYNLTDTLHDISENVGIVCPYQFESEEHIKAFTEHLSQKIGVLLSWSNDAKIEISADPSDYFTASIVDNFKSCYCPGGDEFGVCTLFCMDTHTFIVRYLEENTLKGRFWVHIDFQNKVIGIPPAYGKIPMFVHYTLISFLEKRFNCQLYQIDPFKVIVYHTYAGGRRHAYYLDIIEKWLKSRFFTTELGKSKYRMEICSPENICLECGQPTDETEGFCLNCLPQRVVCDMCGVRIHIDDAIPTEEYIVCADCYHNEFTVCDICETAVLSQDTQEVFDDAGVMVTVCDNCADILKICPLCGESFYTEKDYPVCYDCRQEREQKGKEVISF